MKRHHHSPLWRPKPPYNCLPAVQKLMQTTGLLTLALSTQCGNPLSVTILYEGINAALADEIHTLNLSPQTMGWVRSVLLNCRHKPVLYARSFIPLPDDTNQQAFIQQQHPLAGIQHIANQPLGIWLSQQEALTRSPFEYSLTDHDYWPHLTHHSKQQLPTRRSCFTHAQGAHLLLSEVFL